MPSFSNKSRDQLRTLDGRLQRLLTKAIQIIDFSIEEGHRTKERQKELVDAGLSKTMHSKHVVYPSLAVDIAPHPYPKNKEEIKQLYMLVGVIRGLAYMMDIPIRSGSDWNENWDIRDDKWQDAWHLECKE